MPALSIYQLTHLYYPRMNTQFLAVMADLWVAAPLAPSALPPVGPHSNAHAMLYASSHLYQTTICADKLVHLTENHSTGNHTSWPDSQMLNLCFAIRALTVWPILCFTSFGRGDYAPQEEECRHWSLPFWSGSLLSRTRFGAIWL